MINNTKVALILIYFRVQKLLKNLKMSNAPTVSIFLDQVVLLFSVWCQLKGHTYLNKTAAKGAGLV